MYHVGNEIEMQESKVKGFIAASKQTLEGAVALFQVSKPTAIAVLKVNFNASLEKYILLYLL